MDNGKTNPRWLAAQILNQIIEKEAFADIALDKTVRESSLSALNRAFLTELVYGSVKYLRFLDYLLGKFSRRPIQKLEPNLRHFCRLGLFQIYLLEHIPDPIAVYETVEAAKRMLHKGSLGYLNGLLRSAVRQKENLDQLLPPPSSADYIGVRHSHPQWLVDRWITHWGLTETTELCVANNEVPPLTLRTNTLKVSRADLLANLAKAGLEAEAAEITRDGVILRQGTSIPQLTPLLQGECQVQDLGSMLVAELLAPEPGEKVLDVCSAPGGKSTHLAQLMKNQGQIIAADIHKNRLQLVEENAQRLGVNIIETVVQDASLLFEHTQWQQIFDRVLVDAPCTGLGVLRRRADARWRKKLTDLLELPRLQKAILAGAAGTVRPGGVLVYSTCSIDSAENHEVVQWFLEHYPGWQVESYRDQLNLPAEYGVYLGTDEFARSEYLYTYPHREGTDGFFAVRLRRS